MIIVLLVFDIENHDDHGLTRGLLISSKTLSLGHCISAMPLLANQLDRSYILRTLVGASAW